MKTILQSTIVLLLILSSQQFAIAQAADKTVSLVVSGSGKTQDEAKQNALRSAIEQAFGTFISSKTEILNDNLVKDEIVSVANGNIQKFEVLSEIQLPEGGYATTLNATVSVTKLTSFVESKGLEVEFKGDLFAMNIKLQKLNKEAEFIAVSRLLESCEIILNKSIDFNIVAEEPKESKDGRYSILLKVKAISNGNLKCFNDYFFNSLKQISMNIETQNEYRNLGSKYYLLSVESMIERNNETVLCFRNQSTMTSIKNFLLKMCTSIIDFEIQNGVDSINVRTNNIVEYNRVYGKSPYERESGIVDYENRIFNKPNRWVLNFNYGYPAAIIISSIKSVSTGERIGELLRNNDEWPPNDLTDYYYSNAYIKGFDGLKIYMSEKYEFIHTYQYTASLNEIEKIKKFIIISK
jgi:hypothetical protein